MADREQRVTPLELFFDLVFVYAITQVTLFMSDDPTWEGVGRGLLVLAALWWAWTGYAWLTNILEPEEGRVRAGMFASMAAMLVVALAVPAAFGTDAVLFGVAYLVVRLLQLALYFVAAKRDHEVRRVVLRKVPPTTLAAGIIVLAGFLDGRAQVALWLVALAIDYLGPIGSHAQGLRIAPAHFAERHDLIVIIALGESIVSIGIGAAGETLTPSIVATAVLGIVVIAALWWAYFDVYAVGAQRRLSETSGVARSRLARDYYSYLHLPMIAGIVLFALGLKKTLEDVDDPLSIVPAVALCGGLGLYFLTHVAFRIYLVALTRRTTSERPGWIGPGRLAAGVATLALIPVTREVSALTSLVLVTGVCCGLIAWDLLHYREDRARIRAARSY